MSENADFLTAALKIRNRYLNILEASLTGTLYGDARIDFWSGAIYDPVKRSLGRDWPGVAQTMIGTSGCVT
jgi:O-methyltransferase/8-demethyl-8-(2,3-dimethoxy-alpha-L-rhamnosyl)tetracenomycin-C 4'-O-methyltransferase